MTFQESVSPDAPTPTAAELEAQGPVLVNVFTNMFRFEKAESSLPMAQIVSGLYAAVRWQRLRAFRANDFYDFYHAAAAVPYCHAFFTERFLGTVLSKPPFAVSEQYGTAVVWKESDALDWLNQLT